MAEKSMASFTAFTANSELARTPPGMEESPPGAAAKEDQPECPKLELSVGEGSEKCTEEVQL